LSAFRDTLGGHDRSGLQEHMEAVDLDVIDLKVAKFEAVNLEAVNLEAVNLEVEDRKACVLEAETLFVC
jgi:hypothetical protein